MVGSGIAVGQLPPVRDGVIDCGGKTISISRPTAITGDVVNCRFNVEREGMLTVDRRDGVTIDRAQFYGFQSKVLLSVAQSKNVVIKNSFFHGASEHLLVLNGSSQAAIIDNVFDGSTTERETIFIGPGSGGSFEDTARIRKGVWKPGAQFQSAVNLGGAMGPLNGRKEAIARGGSLAMIPYYTWRKDTTQHFLTDLENPRPDLLRIICAWPGMTGREQFEIVSHDRNAKRLTVRVRNGIFPNGKFAFYIDNPAAFVEQISFKRNTIRGGESGGLSVYFGRGIEIRENTVFTSKDYGLGVEFGENVSFINNRVFNYQYGDGRSTYDGIVMIGFAQNVRWLGNIGRIATGPSGCPQSDLASDGELMVRDPLNLASSGFQLPVPARL